MNPPTLHLRLYEQIEVRLVCGCCGAVITGPGGDDISVVDTAMREGWNVTVTGKVKCGKCRRKAEQ